MRRVTEILPSPQERGIYPLTKSDNIYTPLVENRNSTFCASVRECVPHVSDLLSAFNLQTALIAIVHLLPENDVFRSSVTLSASAFAVRRLLGRSKLCKRVDTVNAYIVCDAYRTAHTLKQGAGCSSEEKAQPTKDGAQRKKYKTQNQCK